MISYLKPKAKQYQTLKLLLDRKKYINFRHAGFSYSGPTAAFAY